MDSLTHIAIGAVIGELSAGKSLGKKAMFWGALFQSIPDIDFIAAFFLEPTENLLVHRGITHSLFFDLFITLGISYGFSRWKKTNQLSFQQWMLFIGIQITVHLFMDALNNYGVGWFEPFSHSRIALNVIFIADPLYSLWPGIAFVILLITSGRSLYRTLLARWAIVLSSLYLFLSISFKFSVNNSLEKTLAEKNIQALQQFTTPTAFTNLLWYCVVEVKDGYYIGYRSVFDNSESINLTYFPRQREFITSIEHEREVQNLLRFSRGYYTIEKQPDALVFNDLRFGRVGGWNNEATEFTFHYYLQRPGKNMLVVQRGRFAELNLETAKSLLKRIQGE